MSDRRRSRRRQSPAHVKRQTTLFVTPTETSQPTSLSLYQGSGINTASDLASTALPTQLVFDTSVAGTPVGAATTGNAATVSVSPIVVGTADVAKSVVTAAPTSDAQSSATPTNTAPASSSGSSSGDSSIPIAVIAVVAIVLGALAGLLLLLWHRKRTRKRGHSHGRVSSSEDGRPPAGDILRKLGTYEKADPFSDDHASQSVDPFADPEKPAHARSGSDSFLSMTPPRQPYTHAVSASTGSSASGRVRKKEMEDARKKDMMALNNLVKALDSKERKAEEAGRDRTSLPPVELFKAALVR